VTTQRLQDGVLTSGVNAAYAMEPF
jgi:hypothetical protein